MQRAVSPRNGVVIRGVNPVCLDNVGVRRTRQCLQRRFDGVCTTVSKRSTRVGIALKGVHSVVIGIVKRIRIPNACQLSTFTSIFRTLCHTKKIGHVNDLQAVRIMQDNVGMTSISICRCVVGKGLASSVHLSRKSIVLMSPCRGLINVSKGIGEPVVCRVGRKRDLTALVNCANKFAKSTCQGAIHLIHHDKERGRVCGISRRSCSGFVLASGSRISIRTMLKHFSGGMRVRKTICHTNVCRLSDIAKAVGQLVRRTRNLHKSTFLGETLLEQRHRSLSRRVVPISLGGLVRKATPSLPLRGGSMLCVSDVGRLRRRKILFVCNSITGPNCFPFTQGVDIRSLVLGTNKLLRSTSAIHVSISQQVGSPGDISSSAIVKGDFAMRLGGKLLVKRDGALGLRPCSVIFMHEDPKCRGRTGIAIGKRIAFAKGCTLAGGGRQLDSLVTGTKKLSGDTCTGNTHLVHEVAISRVQRGRSTIQFTAGKAKGSSISLSSLRISRACSINVRLRGTLTGPGSSRSLMLQRNSMLFIPGCIDAIAIGNTIVCPGAILCRGKYKVSCCVKRTNNFKGQTLGQHTCIMCVGNAISQLEEGATGTVRPKYRVVIPDGKRQGGVAATKTINVDDSVTSVTTVITSVIDLAGWRVSRCGQGTQGSEGAIVSLMSYFCYFSNETAHRTEAKSTRDPGLSSAAWGCLSVTKAFRKNVVSAGDSLHPCLSIVIQRSTIVQGVEVSCSSGRLKLSYSKVTNKGLSALIFSGKCHHKVSAQLLKVHRGNSYCEESFS